MSIRTRPVPPGRPRGRPGGAVDTPRMGLSIVDPVRLRVPSAPVATYRDHRWPLEAFGNQCTDAIVFAQQLRVRTGATSNSNGASRRNAWPD
jgi:hypothetical protein